MFAASPARSVNAPSANRDRETWPPHPGLGKILQRLDQHVSHLFFLKPKFRRLGAPGHERLNPKITRRNVQRAQRAENRRIRHVNSHFFPTFTLRRDSQFAPVLGVFCPSREGQLTAVCCAVRGPKHENDGPILRLVGAEQAHHAGAFGLINSRSHVWRPARRASQLLRGPTGQILRRQHLRKPIHFRWCIHFPHPAKEAYTTFLCVMKIHVLNDDLHFPPVEEAGEHGLLAVGGDLSAARLLAAYEHGAFPWFMPDDPILWWAPSERAMLPLQGLKVSKSMRNELNRDRYRITFDRAFGDVVRGCQSAPRDGEGTWITDDIATAYLALHELGVAHSVETWDDDQLVGGLYGVSLGRMFFGESMFSNATNASKVAFVKLVRWLERRGFGPVDCQIMNPHLASLGAENWPRDTFQAELAQHLHAGATLRGPWSSFEHELERHE